MMYKAAIIFDRFGPYHVARLEAAAQVCKLSGIEVFGESKEYAWDYVDSCGGFIRKTLFPGRNSSAVKQSELRRAVVETLSSICPNVVAIPGWTHPAALAALSWCCQHQVPTFVMSESNAWDEPRRPVVEWLKRKILRLFSACFVGGDSHKEYLISLGMPDQTVFYGYDAIDNDHFMKGADLARAEGNQLRRRIGLPVNYVLASARFVEKKNLFRLLEAYAIYLNKIQEIGTERGGSTHQVLDLVLLGDGELRRELNAKIAALGLQHHVHLPGFKQYDDLPAYYAMAKAFIHCSTTEQWGLVVNEAMAAGLPVLVSASCGCAGNLVLEEKNGFTFDPRSIEDISRIFIKISLISEDQLIAMGGCSREIIKNWGPERFAQGFAAAAKYAMSVPAKTPSLFDRLLLWAMSFR